MIAFSFSTFLVTIINLGILFFVLRALLFKPVTAFMESRAGKIRQSLEDAGKERQEAQALLADYKSRLGNAEGEAAKLIAAARDDARAEAERIIAGGKETVNAMLAAAQKRIELEEEAARAEFRKVAAGLVTAAAAKLAARDFSGEDDLRFADALLGELSPEGAGNGAA